MLLEDAKRFVTALLHFEISHPHLYGLVEMSQALPRHVVELISFVLASVGPDEEKKIRPSHSQSLLHSCFMDALHVIFSDFQHKLKEGGAGGCTTPITSPWHAFEPHLLTLPSFLPALHELWSGIAFLLHTYLQLVASFSLEPTPLLTAFSKELWQPKLVEMVANIEFDMFEPEWLSCLTGGAVCILAAKVATIIMEVEGRENTGPRNRELCGMKVISPLLEGLDRHFPVALYHEYQKWEGQEGGGAGMLVSVNGGGLVLKSVHYLMDALAILATVAKGCNHQQLMKTSSECTLRLVNRSWQHLQKLSMKVPGELPVVVYYHSLSSLVHLHNTLQLLPLQSSQRRLYDDVLLTLSEQVGALKELIVRYHSELSITCLLQDPESSHWENNCQFFEGERCSYTVQMWAYHMSGLQHDLWTYLPSELSASVFLAILEKCLAHFASCCTQACPSPIRTPLFIADVLVVLCCVASFLPYLNLSRQRDSASLHSVHSTCSVLLFVTALVTCPFKELHEVVTQYLNGEKCMIEGSKGVDGVYEWLTFVKMHREHVLSGHLPNLRKLPLSIDVLLPPHPSRFGVLLQVLLSQGATLCVELCSWEEDKKVVSSVLELLSQCPHSVWALAAVYTVLAEKEPDDCNGILKISAFKTLLHHHLGDVLCSYLLSTAVGFHGSMQVVEKSCHALLDTLLEQLQIRLPSPLLALLYCMTGNLKQFTGLTLGEKLAKVLASVMRVCVLDVSHPCYTLLYPTLNLLCFALDPSSPLDHKDPFIHQQMAIHEDHLLEKRKDLALLMDSLTSTPLKTTDPTAIQPKMMLNQEMADCREEEHEMAADIISSNEEGLHAFYVVQSAVRKWWTGCSGCGFSNKDFNPFKEYMNMAVPGTGIEEMLSQQKLMSTIESIDSISLVKRSLPHMAKHHLKLIKSMRWEWHEGGASKLELDTLIS